MSTLSFVNIHGDRLCISADTKPARRPKSEGPEEFHKGFRVVGIPPGAFDAAKLQHEADVRYAERMNERPPAPLVYETFANGFKSKPVRSKPYELREAADQCRELAIKAGWDRVFVVEIKRTKESA